MLIGVAFTPACNIKPSTLHQAEQTYHQLLALLLLDFVPLRHQPLQHAGLLLLVVKTLPELFGALGYEVLQDLLPDHPEHWLRYVPQLLRLLRQRLLSLLNALLLDQINGPILENSGIELT